MIDRRRLPQRSVAHRIGDDFLDLGRAIAQHVQRRRHRLVDDLEIAATGQLLEFHQREIRLDSGGIAIHHQTDRAGRCDHADLRVAITMRLAQLQRLVPRACRQRDQALIGTIGVVQRHRLDVQPFIPLAVSQRGSAVVANDPQHVVRIPRIARKCPQLARHFRGCGIGHTGQDRRQRTGHRAAFVTVISKTHVHQQTADIGIPQTQRAEVIGPLRDFLGRELCHHHADLKRDGPQPRGVYIVLGLKLTVLKERQQIHRRQIAGGIIKEHVFAARVRSADRAVFGACVPRVHGVMILDARIGAGPCGMADLLPQITRLDDLGDLAVAAVDQLPVAVVFHGLQEGVRHTDGVVGVLPAHARIGVRIPVGVIGREFDAGVTLLCIIQHTLDICLGYGDLFRFPNSGLQVVVCARIIGVLGFAVPRLDRRKDRVQILFMHLGPGHDARDLLFLDDFPVDEILDVGVIRIDNHHLRRAAGGAAGLDGPCGTVADLQETHQARRLAAARQLLALSAER